MIFSIHFPEFKCSKITSPFTKFHRFMMNFPTKILIDSDPKRWYTIIQLLGFGISIKLWSKL